MMQYLRHILVALDQLANTLMAGDPDETISSRMGKYVQRGRGFVPCLLCKLLDLMFREKDHCVKNIEIDEGLK